MENQNYITIVEHIPMTGNTNFVQVTGRELDKHIETELWLGRERHKTLTNKNK
jgi:hypothetical protein